MTGMTLQGNQVTKVRFEFSFDGRRSWNKLQRGSDTYNVAVTDDPDGKVYIKLDYP